MKIALYSQKYKKEYAPIFKEIFNIFLKNNDDIFVEEKLWQSLVKSAKQQAYFSFQTFGSKEDLDASFDVFLTIGGDGTILRAISYVQNLEIPVLGINAGRLGFLATVIPQEIPEMLQKIRQKKFRIEQRSVLEILTKDNTPLTPLNFALNEVAVIRRNTTSMITVETYLDQEYLTSYWADGLIISTPTGSTGYSLSCGGPVITPSSKTLVITPIAPHNLNARPLIIPENTEVLLRVSSREHHYFVSFDAQLKSLPCRESVIIRKASFSLKMIQLEGNSFFKTLRNKLLWGEDKRN